MKSRALAALLALPLLAFDCGGADPPPSPGPLGMDCRLEIRGAANEDLWCIVTAYDYSDLAPTNPEWLFELAAYRGMTEVGAGVGLFITGRPALGVPYGWTATTSTVDSGSASRTVGDLGGGGSPVYTHEAWAPLLVDAGQGALSVTFTAVPPEGATQEQLVQVHGTLAGTLPPVSGAGGGVTFAATF